MRIHLLLEDFLSIYVGVCINLYIAGMDNGHGYKYCPMGKDTSMGTGTDTGRVFL